MIPKTYCLHCKKNTKNIKPYILRKRNRHQLISNCETCKHKKTRFIRVNKVLEKHGGSVANTIINLPFELHLIDWQNLRKYNFAGPGTKLEKRLNPDDTPKEDSIPINKLDEGAYYHDLCYRDHTDTESRTECDKHLKTIADKFSHDPNASVSDKVNAKIVKLIMDQKIKLES